MKKQTLVIILILAAVFTNSCNSKSNSASEPSDSERNELTSSVFTTQNNYSEIKFISDSKCELRNGREIVLCEYSMKQQKIRIITNNLGASHVIYLNLTSDGLISADGIAYLNQTEYNATRERMRITKESTERQRILKEQKEREDALAARIAEEKKAADMKRYYEDCKKPTKTIGQFQLKPEEGKPIGVVVKDTCILVYKTQNEYITVYYVSMNHGGRGFKPNDGSKFGMLYWFNEKGISEDVGLTSKTVKEADQLFFVMRSAFDSWEAKYPEAKEAERYALEK